MNSLNDMLTQMVEKNASDLHLTVGSPVRMRINGKLMVESDEKLNPKNIEELLELASNLELKFVSSSLNNDLEIYLDNQRLLGRKRRFYKILKLICQNLTHRGLQIIISI